MKKILFFMSILPMLSFANLYECNGSGFKVLVNSNPDEIIVSGNGLNNTLANINVSSTFDTVFTGNTPSATLKLTVKDSSFGNPGDSFKGILQISNANGIKEFNLNCVKGND